MWRIMQILEDVLRESLIISPTGYFQVYLLTQKFPIFT